jgi:hypothetical protein
MNMIGVPKRESLRLSSRREESKGKQKPRVITPGLLALKPAGITDTVCQTIFMIGRVELAVKT